MSRRTGEVRGSLGWTRTAVNDCTSVLNDAIVTACGGGLAGPITWKSPLRTENYEEYQDAEFLRRLGTQLPRRPLHDFWPAGGPHWDALGTCTDGSVVLVEAKAHANEAKSDCRASSPVSLERIRTSLREAQRHYGADESRDWTRSHYQYANRLAHLHLLRDLNGVKAWLVFLYFVGDSEMGGPSRAEDWQPVQRSIHDALGIRELPRFAVNAYLDVRLLRVAAGAGGVR